MIKQIQKCILKKKRIKEDGTEDEYFEEKIEEVLIDQET